MHNEPSYYVIMGGCVLEKFKNFSDAWVYTKLSCRNVFAIIIGHDGYWVINPSLAN
jgi:hypothetical protein